MGFEGLLKFISEKLGGAKIRYALIGGVALHAAGYSRSTGDVDLLVHEDDISSVKKIFQEIKYHVMSENDEFVQLSSPWGLVGAVDLMKARRSYTWEMLRRSQPHEFRIGMFIPVVLSEDIIGLKVQAMVNNPARRKQDEADIDWLIRNATPDRGRVEEYFKLFSLEADFTRLWGGATDA